MDVLVRRNNKSSFGSYFLGHAKAEETFQAVHGKLDLTHNFV